MAVVLSTSAGPESGTTVWQSDNPALGVLNASSFVKADKGSVGLVNAVVAALLYVIVIITVVGNGMVLLAVGRNRHLQTVFNMYIVNLALTDILVALTAMSFYTTENLLGYWPFGHFMCGMWIFFDYGMTFASVFTLLAISVDRLWAVRWSLHYRTHKTRAKTCLGIALIWISMLILWLPPCIADRLANKSRLTKCIWEPSRNKPFVIVVAVIGHHGSCVTILFCYISILLLLRQRNKVGVGFFSVAKAARTVDAAAVAVISLPGTSSSHPDGTADGSSVTFHQMKERLALSVADANVTPSDFKDGSSLAESKVAHVSYAVQNKLSEDDEAKTDYSSERNTKLNIRLKNQPHLTHGTGKKFSVNQSATESSSSRATGDAERWRVHCGSDTREMKAFVTLSYIVLSYVVCWIPFHVVFDVSAVRPELVSDLLYNVTFWMTYLNSTINPILYNFSSRDFRRAFKDICKGRS